MFITQSQIFFLLTYPVVMNNSKGKITIDTKFGYLTTHTEKRKKKNYEWSRAYKCETGLILDTSKANGRKYVNTFFVK